MLSNLQTRTWASPPLNDPTAQVNLQESLNGGAYEDKGTKTGHGEDNIASMGPLTPPVNQHWYVNGERVQLVMGMNDKTGKPILTWEVHIDPTLRAPGILLLVPETNETT